MPPDAEVEDGVRRPLLAGQEGREPPVEDEQGQLEGQVPEQAAAGTFQRNLGALEAFAIIISIVIGSGVFTSPGAIDTNVPSPGAALIIWLVGGVLAWTGASTLAELGTAIPGEGGVQPYLQHIYGDVAGFLAAWTWIVAVMPATLAILSIVFVESIYSAAGVTDQAGRIEHKALSIAVLVAVTVANSINTKASTRLNNFFVVTKFTSIAVVVVAALAVVGVQLAHPGEHDGVGGGDWSKRPWFAPRESVNPDGSRTDWTALSQWELLGHYSAALYGALWAYSGWDKAVYISAEMSAPARQLPLAINASIPVIILCFILANAAYYILLPWNVVSTTDSVAVTAITRLLGPGFGIAAAVLICLVVAGSLLGNSFVAGRMAVSAANKNWLPRVFAAIGRLGTQKAGPGGPLLEDVPSEESDANTDNNGVVVSNGGESTGDNGNTGTGTTTTRKGERFRSDAPINALALSATLSALYILLGSFRALLTFNGLGEYSFFFLTVLGAVLLRFREPGLPRPYRPPLAVPATFAAVSGFVVVRGAAFAPLQALVLVSLWLLGVLVYYARGRLFGVAGGE